MGRWCVLKGMQLLLWDSEKSWQKGKKAVEEVPLNHRTQAQALGKKMGKAFCIHVLTNGANEAFWARDTEDQNSWLEAINAACKKPEEPKAMLMQGAPMSQSSHSDIKIELALPQSNSNNHDEAAAAAIAYQNALMQQQYQQQLAAYNQQLAFQQQQLGAAHQQPPIMYPPPAASTSSAYGSYSSSAQFQQSPPPAAPFAAPLVSYPSLSVPDSYYTHASPAVSPAPSPSMPRHSPPPHAPPSAAQLSSKPTSSAYESQYGRF